MRNKMKNSTDREHVYKEDDRESTHHSARAVAKFGFNKAEKEMKDFAEKTDYEILSALREENVKIQKLEYREKLNSDSKISLAITIKYEQTRLLKNIDELKTELENSVKKSSGKIPVMILESDEFVHDLCNIQVE